MGCLRHARTYDRDVCGIAYGCEPYGDGEPIVAVGVTPHQGVRESRMQGEVAQVIQRPETRKVCEIAERRNGAGCLARARQAWSAAGEAVSATVQPRLYLVAYKRLYANKGAMTPGVTAETVDGMSLAKIGRIIAAVRAERWRWRPVKRVHIPKRNGKRRALGLPTWSDKLLAEVVRMLLEAYYDPQFSDHAHGFRPGRGCQTALSEVVEVWKGTHWFIEGDIAQCFDSLDRQVMLKTLGEKIHDGRFLRLVEGMLSAGYLQQWTWARRCRACRKAGSPHPSSAISTSTGSISSSKRSCCRCTTEESAGPPTLRMNASGQPCEARSGVGIGQRRRRCAGNCGPFPA